MKQSKVAIVTGASRGIGRTLAIGLARLSYKVVVVARTTAELTTIAEEAEVPAASIIHYSVDVSKEDKITKCIQDVINQLGRIDIFINNAGVFKPGTLEASVKDLDLVYNINLRAGFIFMQNIVPIMKKQKSGYIFNISSISGKIGYDQYGVYASSKFGLVGLSQSLFRELTKEGIKVTSICPSWVATDMADIAGSKYHKSDMIQLDDIMSTVKWLLSLSPSASIEEVVIECSKSVA